MALKAKFSSNKSRGILGEPDSEDMWNEILNHIPDKLLVKPGVSILNIGCGQGTEAVLLAKRMFDLGISKDAVNESIHLVDNSTIYTNYVKGWHGFKNVYCADFLTWESDMKFDIVVGNPPYQNGDNSHFYKRFIEVAKSVSDVMAFVVPSSYFNNTQAFDNLRDYAYKGKVFANVDLAASWFIWQRDYSKACRVYIDDECLEVEKFALPPSNNLNMFKFINNSMISGVSHYKIAGGKLLRKDAQLDDTGVWCIWSCGGNSDDFDKALISDKHTNMLGGFGVHKVVFSKAYGGYTKVQGKIYPNLGGIKYADPQQGCANGSRFITVDSQIEAVNLIAYLNSKFVKSIVGNVKKGIDNTQMLFDAIPRIDNSRTWSDAEIYQHFKLDNSLIEYIDPTF